jgi:hypothetical protein
MVPTGATGLGRGSEAGQLGARPAAAQTKARPWRAPGYLPTSELSRQKLAQKFSYRTLAESAIDIECISRVTGHGVLQSDNWCGP